MVDTGFIRPLLNDLINRSEGDINTNLVGADANLRRSVLNVLGKVHSGQTHGLYGYQKYISRQAIVDTADTTSLEHWGKVWKITRKPADKASGYVVFLGEEGTIIPSGTELSRANQATFTTQESVQIIGGTVSVLIKANVAGDFGNTAENVEISLLASIAGVSATGTAGALGIAGGADIETDGALLSRILEIGRAHV